MRIFCAICKDVFIPKSDVKALRCGHLYHDTCLNQWLQIRSNCPQCRALAVDKCRIYFDVEAGSEDPSILQSQVESLHEQNLNNQIVIVDLRKQLEVLEAAKRDLTMQSKNLLEQIEIQRGKILSMEGQTSFIQLQKRQINQLREENLSLEEKLKGFKNLSRLLEENGEGVRAMIQNTPVNKTSIDTLCVYVNVLKAQLVEYKNKWRKESDQLAQCRYTITNLKKKIPRKIFTVDKKTGPDEIFVKDKGVITNDINNNEVTSRKRYKKFHLDKTPESPASCTQVGPETGESSGGESDVVPIFINIKRPHFSASNCNHKLTQKKMLPRKITKY